MRRFVRILLVVLLLAVVAGGTAAWLAAPRYSPRVARARGVACLARERYEDGLLLLQAYSRRFPQHALAASEVLVGKPVRLRLEFTRLGLLLDGPNLPPRAAVSDVTIEREQATAIRTEDVLIERGPRWVSETRLTYAVEHTDGRAELVTLDVTSRDYAVRDVPEPAMRMSFEAVCALLDADPAVFGLTPDLGGATQPELLAVSPDRSWLILRAAASGEYPYELWRCRPDGADASRLCPLETACRAVSFDPAGTRLAFFDGPAVKTVGLADTESVELKRYETAAVLSPAAPTWSADGHTLAYGIGSADRWRLATCPVDQPDQLLERPRLHALTGLQFVGLDRLLQSQQQFDTERHLVTLRLAADQFASRILFDDGRDATLSPRGDLLAFRSGNRIRCLLLPAPLAELSAELLPEANLPERPVGPPEPASPAPDDASPPPPKRRTTPL